LPEENLSSDKNRSYYLDWLYVPRSGEQKGLTPENSLFALCDEETLDDPVRGASLERSLHALLRAHFLKGFDREGGEEDYALVAEFVRPRAAQAAAYCRRRILRVEADALGPLARALLMSARLLDVDGAHANDHAGWLAAIFAGVDEPAAPPPGET